MIVDLITSPSLASQGPQTIRFCSNTCALHQTYGSRTPTTLRNVTSGGSLGPRICFCHRDISKAHEVTSRTDPPEAAQTRTGAGSSRHKTGGTSSDNQDISQLLRLRSACRRNRPNKAQISSSAIRYRRHAPPPIANEVSCSFLPRIVVGLHPYTGFPG